jgi:hypothetical protein
MFTNVSDKYAASVFGKEEEEEVTGPSEIHSILHGITYQKTIFSVTAVETANPTQESLQFFINFVINKFVCCFSQIYAAVF